MKKLLKKKKYVATQYQIDNLRNQLNEYQKQTILFQEIVTKQIKYLQEEREQDDYMV
jgi:hypothetical protein